jgi:hypothetical protein
LIAIPTLLVATGSAQYRLLHCWQLILLDWVVCACAHMPDRYATRG